MTWYTVPEAQKLTGVSRNQLNSLILYDKVPTQNGMLGEDTVSRILHEKETYISLLEYALVHTSERFNGKSASDRRKLLDVLENNHYFGLQVTAAYELLIGTDKDVVFFYRKDMGTLDANLASFFGDFALTPMEKIA